MAQSKSVTPWLSQNGVYTKAPRSDSGVPRKKISALILAAGRGSRAQTFKPLLRWKSENFLEKVHRSLSETSFFEEILVVTGFQKENLEKILSDIDAKHVYNDLHLTGMQSSIQMGLKSLKKNWDGAMIALIDQPQLEASDYALIAQDFLSGDRTLVRPSFAGRFGNPAVIGRAYLSEVLKAPADDRGCAYLFNRYPDDVAITGMPDDRCLHDFDSEVILEKYVSEMNLT